jgi:hypothetical protein
MEPFSIDAFGRWSYACVLIPYVVLLGFSMWRFRVILGLVNWRFFFKASFVVLLVLGLFFEMMACAFKAWAFPEGRHLFQILIPIFGWFTGHRIPIEEFLWIALVIPLFYYLYLWTTLVFYDVIFVIDTDGSLYKREERWVGFFGETRISRRRRGERGREHETPLLVRSPGWVARSLARWSGRK